MLRIKPLSLLLVTIRAIPDETSVSENEMVSPWTQGPQFAFGILHDWEIQHVNIFICLFGQEADSFFCRNGARVLYEP